MSHQNCNWRFQQNFLFAEKIKPSQLSISTKFSKTLVGNTQCFFQSQSFNNDVKIYATVDNEYYNKPKHYFTFNDLNFF